MSKLITFSLLFFLLQIYAAPLAAQRIYGAEVYKEVLIDDVNIEAWVWRQGGSKPFIMYDWGDGSPLDSVPLKNSLHLGYYEGQNYYLDIYYRWHNYDTAGVYVMGFRDSFLVDDIVNIEESGNKRMEVFDTVAIYSQFTHSLAINETPRFFTQQGNIREVDGNIEFPINLESIDFLGELYRGELVPFPAEGYSTPAASDSIYMSYPAGLKMIWDDPIAPGRYAVGILVREWRQNSQSGELDTFFMSTTMRAMTMLVTEELLLTSIPEREHTPALVSVYPNPATSVVNIDYATPGQMLELSVLSLDGKLMHRSIAEADARVRTEQVPVADWPAGVYILRVQSGARQWVRKFVVE